MRPPEDGVLTVTEVVDPPPPTMTKSEEGELSIASAGAAAPASDESMLVLNDMSTLVELLMVVTT